jgi:hypothetical protein
MKSKPFSGILWGLLVSLAIVSCGGSPKPVETPPPEPPPAQEQPKLQPLAPVRDPDLEPPDQAAIEDMYKALAQADVSRKRAQDIDAPGYFPPEWEAAEGRYGELKEKVSDATLGELKKTIALYEEAAETYDNLARQCIPLFYEDLSGEILQARDEAIAAGIRALSPNRLEAADLCIDKALELYDTGNAAGTNNAAAENYYAAAASAFDALDRYIALGLGVRAYRLGEEILERDFGGYDPENYALAEKSMDEAVAAYDGGDSGVALAQAEEALLRRTLVLNAGWLGYAGDLKLSADAERRNALSYKANVAVKKAFGDADGLYTRGTAAFNAQDYAASAEYFTQAIPLFAEVIKAAEQKRVVAEEAIRTAETRIGQSEETAREAESLLQGGER